MALHVVLVEPEIPPNTGNIARTCAATGAVLHLVKPMGFTVDDSQVKRAGLDYWPYVNLVLHEGLHEFLREYQNAPLFLATTRGKQSYTEITYPEEAFFLFGKETQGLPKWLVEEKYDQTIRIPMTEQTHLRSLNLSNSVSIIVFEALRQRGFPGLR